jgi:serine/threonine protein kinase
VAWARSIARATHASTASSAIKVLPPRLAADPQFRARFQREARAISALEHPHICALYDVGEERREDEVVHFLVMQYLEGETLADRLAHAGRAHSEPLRSGTSSSAPGSGLPLQEALTIAIQVADALDRAHRAGVVHRDLKPGNIMIVRRGGASASPEAKLLDFGLARLGTAGAIAQAGLTAAATAHAPLTSEGRSSARGNTWRPNRSKARSQTHELTSSRSAASSTRC